MKSVKVEQFNGAKNQFLISTEDGKYFQSYDSVIAFISINGSVTLDRNTWDYSQTTGRYRNMFLGEGIAETRRKIEEGVYILDDLN